MTDSATIAILPEIARGGKGFGSTTTNKNTKPKKSLTLNSYWNTTHYIKTERILSE